MSYIPLDFENIPQEINKIYNDITAEDPRLTTFQIVDMLIFEFALEITALNYKKTLIYGCLLNKIRNEYSDFIISKYSIQNELVDTITINELVRKVLLTPKDVSRDFKRYFKDENPNISDDSPTRLVEFLLLPNKLQSSILYETPYIVAPDSFALDYFKNLIQTYIQSFIKIRPIHNYKQDDVLTLIRRELE